jgi:hypothetical protein
MRLLEADYSPGARDRGATGEAVSAYLKTLLHAAPQTEAKKVLKL